MLTWSRDCQGALALLVLQVRQVQQVRRVQQALPEQQVPPGLQDQQAQ